MGGLKKRYWVLLIGLIYLIGVGFTLYAKFVQRPDLFSSPTASRNVPLYEESDVGLLQAIDYETDEGRPTSERFAKPKIVLGDDHDYMATWPDEPVGTEVMEAEDWSSGLLGDDALELVAFATWVPGAEDDVAALASDPDARIPLTYRDPAGLEEVSLEALGVPSELHGLKWPEEYELPRLRLIFRAPTMEVVRIDESIGGDPETEAQTAYELEQLAREKLMTEQVGEWIAYDLLLLIWHDRPMQVRLSVLTGEPVVQSLPPILGEEVVFGDQLRVQWLMDHRGGLRQESDEKSGFSPLDPAEKAAFETLPEDTTAWLDNSEPDAETLLPWSILRMSSRNQTRHLGWRQADGRLNWEFDYLTVSDSVKLLKIQREPSPEPLELVFVPSRAEVVFEIAGLPDLPNPREVEDLFEVKIPRLTLPESDTEERLLQVVALATQQSWEIDERWNNGNAPPELPVDRTFRHTTPQALINWYLDHTPGAKVEHDEAGLRLLVNQSEGGVWQQIKAWFDEKTGWIGYYF